MTGFDDGVSRNVVIVFALANLVGFAARGLLPAIAPLLKQDHGFSNGDLGLLLGPALGVPFGLGSILSGVLADRGHARALVAGGFVLVVISTIMAVTAPTLPMMAASRALLGLGQSAFFTPALLFLMPARSGGTTHRGRATALAGFTMGSSLGRGIALIWTGGILAIAALAGVADDMAWRWPGLLLLVPQAAILGVLIGRTLRTADAAVSPPPDDLADMLPATVTLTIAFVIGTAAVAALQTNAAWYPVFLVEGFAMTTPRAASLAGIVAIVGAPAAQMLGGWMVVRYPAAARRPLVVATLALVVAVVPLMAMIVARTPWLSATAALANTLAGGVATFSALYAIQHAVGPARRGIVTGWYMAATMLIGLGLGPLIVGTVSQGGLKLGPAILLVGGATAAVALIALMAGQFHARTVTR